jgi:hypothetical protein
VMRSASHCSMSPAATSEHLGFGSGIGSRMASSSGLLSWADQKRLAEGPDAIEFEAPTRRRGSRRSPCAVRGRW